MRSFVPASILVIVIAWFSGTALAAPVTIVVVPGGYQPQRTYTAPFVSGRSVHWALEHADAEDTGAPLRFEIEFYRTPHQTLGYFVTAVNDFPSTPLSTWSIYYDSHFACQGIDQAKIHSGETIRFQYELIGGHDQDCKQLRLLQQMRSP